MERRSNFPLFRLVEDPVLTDPAADRNDEIVTASETGSTRAASQNESKDVVRLLVPLATQLRVIRALQ